MQAGRIDDALPLSQQALQLAEQSYQSANERLATALKFVGNVYLLTGDLAAAEQVLARAVALSETAVGPQHPETAKHIGNLTAVAIQEAAFGPENPRLINLLKNMATALHRLEQTTEATTVEERIAALSSKPNHPASS